MGVLVAGDRKEFIDIADSKAAAHQIRVHLAQAGGSDCFPLPQTAYTPTLLNRWVLNPPTLLQPIRLPISAEADPAIGAGFEMELGKLHQATDTDEAFH